MEYVTENFFEYDSDLYMSYLMSEKLVLNSRNDKKTYTYEKN